MKSRLQRAQPKRVPDRRKLTQLLVAKITPGHRRTRVWDTEAPGLVLQVEPSGSKSWYQYYRRSGCPRWHRLGPVGSIDLRDARDVVRHLNAKLMLDPAFDPQAEKNANRMQGTVIDLVEVYKSGHLQHLKVGKRPAYLLERYVVPVIGKLPASSVQRSDIRKLLDSIATPSMRQQIHANISAMFGWAIRKELVSLVGNPAAGIDRVKLRARERILSNREVPLFWDALDQVGLTASRALRIIYLTGQRSGEVRHMRWQDLELGEHQLTDNNGRGYTANGAWWTLAGQPSDDGTWPGTKNGHTHRVWLSAPTLAIIEEIEEERQPGDPSPYVIKGQGTRPMIGFDKAMHKVCATLEIQLPDKITPHDLRRTHGTTITSLGFTRDQMNRIQNHKEGGIASVYDRHSYLHEARLIQETVGERITVLVFGTSSTKVVDLRR